jgi:hypothetical protein
MCKCFPNQLDYFCWREIIYQGYSMPPLKVFQTFIF